MLIRRRDQAVMLFLVRMHWIVSVIVIVLLGSLAYASSAGAPWVPTWMKDMHRLQRLLALRPGEKFIELGCGNGRVCRYLASEPQAQIDGLELSLIQWMIASLQSLPNKNVRILFGNVFRRDLSKYDAVYLFLMPETYAKLQPKFDHELKPGTRVVSYVWPIPNWTPVKIDKEEGRPDLYLYVIGMKAQ